jgi:hypothetical protein
MSGKEKMSDEQTGGHAASAETLNTNHAGPVSGTALGSDIQAKIGQHLRAMYDDVVRQGVPDRFLDLLSQLDKTDDEPKSGGGRR